MKRSLWMILIILLALVVGCSPVGEENADVEESVETINTVEQGEDHVVNESEDSAIPENNDENAENEGLADEEVADVVEYLKITAEEAKDMMVEENLVVDVRTQEEYDMGHIEGALLVPLNTLMLEDFVALPDKDQVILVYCRSGNRSRSGAQILIDAGYTKVYDFGGINTWPYDLVK